MGRLRKTSIFTAGLVALAGIAIYTQIEDTSLIHGGLVSKPNSELQTAEIENTRRERPTPGALIAAVEPAVPASTSDSRTPAPALPVYEPAAASSFSDAGKPLDLADKVEQVEWVQVSGSVVNVRSGPSASSPRIGSFPEGTRLRVVERGAGWTKIEDPETGQSGWMKGDYLAGLSDADAPAS